MLSSLCKWQRLRTGCLQHAIDDHQAHRACGFQQQKTAGFICRSLTSAGAVYAAGSRGRYVHDGSSTDNSHN